MQYQSWMNIVLLTKKSAKSAKVSIVEAVDLHVLVSASFFTGILIISLQKYLTELKFERIFPWCNPDKQGLAKCVGTVTEIKCFPGSPGTERATF